jgi:PAS domain S-box-containing protein
MVNLLQPPVFPDFGTTQAARMLHIILWTTIGTISLMIVGLLTIPAMMTRWLTVFVALWIIFAATQWMMRSGRVRGAAIMFLHAIWMLVTALSLTAGGLRAPITAMYLPLVFITGLLLGTRVGIIAALINTATLLIFMLLEITGTLPSPTVHHTPFTQFFITALFTIIMVGLQHLSASTIATAHRRSAHEQHERKQAEAHLRSTADMITTTFEMSPDGIVLTTLKESRIIQCNDEFLRQIGYQYDEVIGRTTYELNLWAPGAGREAILAKLSSGDEIRQMEMNVRRKDGAVRLILFSARVITLAGEQIMLTVGHDITERKQYETAIRQSEEELRNLFDNSVLGIYRTTPGGRVLMVNPALCKMLGYSSPEELMTKNLETDSYAPGYTREAFKRRIESEKVIRGFETVWLKADGSTIYVRENAKAVRDSSGKILYYEGTVEDISERINAEKALRFSEEGYRRLFENITEGFTIYRVISDENGKAVDLEFEEVNPISAEFFGRPREELAGARYLALFPDSGAAWVQTIARVARRGNPTIDRYWTTIHRGVRFMEVRCFKTGENHVAVIASDHTEEENSRIRLAENEKRLQRALRVGQMGYIDWDLKTNRVEWSEETFHMYGRPPGEFTPSIDATLEPIHHGDREFVEHQLKAAILGETEFNTQFRIHRYDGIMCHLRALGEVSRNERGEATRLLITLVDTTAQETAAAALQETETRLRQVIDLVPQFIFAKNKLGQFILVNQALADAYGTTVENLLGKTDADFNTNSIEVANFLKDDFEVINSGRRKDISEERITDSRGQVRYLHTVKIPFHLTSSAERAILGVSTDITEQKMAEEELRKNTVQLRQLSNRLRAIREEESTRIAREIHDELGQTLTALKMDIAMLEDKFPFNDAAGRESAAHISGMTVLIDSAIRTVRRISSELRPAALDRFGLTAAIEWQADEFRKRTGISCICNLPKEEMEIDPEVNITIFRILQESLTNITRHAGASVVRISLWKKNNSMVLQVDDDGKGIRSTDQKKQGSFGLLGIRERASALDGAVTISSAPDKGTSIIVAIPMKDLNK